MPELKKFRWDNWSLECIHNGQLCISCVVSAQDWNFEIYIGILSNFSEARIYLSWTVVIAAISDTRRHSATVIRCKTYEKICCQINVVAFFGRDLDQNQTHVTSHMSEKTQRLCVYIDSLLIYAEHNWKVALFRVLIDKFSTTTGWQYN